MPPNQAPAPSPSPPSYTPPTNLTPNGGHNPYEFIVAEDKQREAKFKIPGGDNKTQRALIVAGGAIVLIIIISLLYSLISSSGHSDPQLTIVTQKQQEIIRVATDGARHANNQSTKNFAINTELTIQSNQGELISYLADHGTKLSKKTLNLGIDSKTDTLLTNASATNTYDSTVEQELVTELTDYQAALKQAYQGVSGKTLQGILNHSYDNASLLIEQGKDAINTP
ncbi:MAG: hypothetical protein ABI220_01155 [Candidatus Saccharimonadales bacterium]